MSLAEDHGHQKGSKMADLANEEKPAIAPPVFVFQKDKAQKRSADGSSAEDGEDSDKEDGYCPPVKRERTSSQAHFPPSHTVSKNNVFMPSSFCQSPTGNSDSEPEEKTVGFRLKPPTLIHGQAPSAGVPSQKPKEQQRSVLRPAVLQAPPTKRFTLGTQAIFSDSKSCTNGVNQGSEGPLPHQNAEKKSADTTAMSLIKDEEQGKKELIEKSEVKSSVSESSSFVFGQNLKDRAKVKESNESKSNETDSPLSEETNYFLQYISSNTSFHQTANSDDSSSKFVFGQNMSDRVLSPLKSGEPLTENSKEAPPVPSCEPLSSKDSTSEKGTEVASNLSKMCSSELGEVAPVQKNNVAAESLEASAAAYTKATAKRCILEKVEVRTGEESESNVLQMQCKLFVFDKSAQSWVERGCGLLRLNDMASTDDGTLQSRLVMRTQGSLRLILNTKLWVQMQVDKASEKSIRITAMDTEDKEVKVFLILASSKDAGQLFAALHHRILALRSRAEQEPEVKTTLPVVTQSNEEDSDEDDAPSTASAPAAGNTEAGEAQSAGST
ncbi:ran-binding protein 3a [Denticeps clupeoides]|nr:ran-binding protein 3 [Denticeps clupeoides]